VKNESIKLPLHLHTIDSWNVSKLKAHLVHWTLCTLKQPNVCICHTLVQTGLKITNWQHTRQLLFFNTKVLVFNTIGTLSNDNADGDGNAIRSGKSKGLLRMTGGKQVDVLRSGPTWVKLISHCLKTWVFAFVSSAVSMLNDPCYLFGGTLMLVSSCYARYFILKKRREIWSELKPVGEHVSTVKYLFESLCK